MADGIGAIFHDVEMYMYRRVIDVYKAWKSKAIQNPENRTVMAQRVPCALWLWLRFLSTCITVWHVRFTG